MLEAPRGPPRPPAAPRRPPPRRPPPPRATQVSVGWACGWVRTLSFSQAAGGLLRVWGGGPPLAGLVGAAERHQAPWLLQPAGSGTALTGPTHWRRPPTSGLLSAARARLRGCGGEFPGQRARALRSGRGQIGGQASEAAADARAKASPPARPWPPAGSRAVPCPWIPSALIAAGQGSNSHFLARLSLPRGRTI